ncbi:hypothetical protein K438DRAFT_1808040 [Mycena galopus ATCC 62051]|nr:hypothetical protein K438DRAFT_1808040 [Mycena galopus ATCC 62051]
MRTPGAASGGIPCRCPSWRAASRCHPPLGRLYASETGQRPWGPEMSAGGAGETCECR